MTILTPYYALRGGTDMVTAAIEIKPGVARAATNYMPVLAGLRRTGAFERTDGQPKPSLASYWILDYDAGTDAISAGDIITGDSSGHTGEALIDAVIESGSTDGNDAAGYVVMVNVDGTFTDDEALKVGGDSKATADGVVQKRGADTDALDATYYQDAIETTRDDIAAVPGTGNMRGVWVFAGVKYAFRDNAGATAVDMYKASTSGWQLQDLGETMDFTSGGTATIVEGNTVTGDSSAKTAVVKRVIVTSGTFAAGTAAGRLIVYSVSGAFTPGEGLEVSASNVATLTADAVPNTLTAGGRFEFVNYNFGGHASTRRMYGVDGVSLGFEWDGAVFTPIITSMTTDKPIHVFAHRKHLFYAFTGGSLQNSGIGNPYSWTVITGAAEIGIGEEITGLSESTSQVMVIFGRNSIALLYGFDNETWDLIELATDSGAIEWTNQTIGTPTYMDDIGLRSLDTTQKFGDFQLGSLSLLVQPIFDANKKNSVTAQASIRVRSRDQYRLFWSDGTGLTLYLGREKPELMRFDLGKVVHCTCSGEDANGNEILLFGSTDGFIYELDAGTSQDGSTLDAFVRFPFNHVGSPSIHKQWRKLSLELDAVIDTEIQILTDFGSGDPEAAIVAEQSFTVQGGGGYWDLDNWDEFFWDADAVGTARIPLEGGGTNISVSLLTSATYEEDHTIHGIKLHYSPLRLQR